MKFGPPEKKKDCYIKSGRLVVATNNHKYGLRLARSCCHAPVCNTAEIGRERARRCWRPSPMGLEKNSAAVPWMRCSIARTMEARNNSVRLFLRLLSLNPRRRRFLWPLASSHKCKWGEEGASWFFVATFACTYLSSEGKGKGECVCVCVCVLGGVGGDVGLLCRLSLRLASKRHQRDAASGAVVKESKYHPYSSLFTAERDGGMSVHCL